MSLRSDQYENLVFVAEIAIEKVEELSKRLSTIVNHKPTLKKLSHNDPALLEKIQETIKLTQMWRFKK